MGRKYPEPLSHRGRLHEQLIIKGQGFYISVIDNSEWPLYSDLIAAAGRKVGTEEYPQDTNTLSVTVTHTSSTRPEGHRNIRHRRVIHASGAAVTIWTNGALSHENLVTHIKILTPKDHIPSPPSQRIKKYKNTRIIVIKKMRSRHILRTRFRRLLTTI